MNLNWGFLLKLSIDLKLGMICTCIGDSPGVGSMGKSMEFMGRP